MHRCCGCSGLDIAELSRRGFLEGAVLGGTALTGLSWPLLAAAHDELPAPPPRRPLVVKPVLVYSLPTRAPQTSWRNWGGIQTQADADGECTRIGAELKNVKSPGGFPGDVPARLPRQGSEGDREESPILPGPTPCSFTPPAARSSASRSWASR